MRSIFILIVMLGSVTFLKAQKYKGETNGGMHFKYKQTFIAGAEEKQRFGYALDERNGVLISGNPKATVNGFSEDGNANIYEFNIDSQEWELKQKLIPWGYIDSGGEFGIAVGINDDFAFVGALRGNDEIDSKIYGMVYIFKKKNGNWEPHQRLLGNIDTNSSLGRKIKISDSTAVIMSNDSLNVYGLNNQTGFWEKEYASSKLPKEIEVDDNQFFTAVNDSLFFYEKVNNKWKVSQSMKTNMPEMQNSSVSMKYSNNHLALGISKTGLKGAVSIYEREAKGIWSKFSTIDDISTFKGFSYGLELDLDDEYLVFNSRPYAQRMLSGYQINRNDVVIYKRGTNGYEYHQHLIIEDQDWKNIYRLKLTKGGLICSNTTTNQSEMYSFTKMNVDDWEYKSIKCGVIDFCTTEIEAPGTYFDTVVNGVNRIVKALFVLDLPTEYHTSSVVSETPYEYNGILFKESARVVDTLTNIYGCDSILDFKLYITKPESLSPLCNNAKEFQVGYYNVKSGEDGWGKFVAKESGVLTISSCGLTEEDTYLSFNSNCETEIAKSDDSCGDLESELSHQMILGDTIFFKWWDEYDHDKFLYEIKFEPEEKILSIEEIEKETTTTTTTTIYPNPTKDILHIKNPQQKKIRIYSLQGETLLEANGVSHLDISNLENGVYYLLLGTEAFKIVKY